MYDFHYNYIKKKYGNNAQLLFEDVYKDFWSDKDKFDFIVYTKESNFYDATNKKIVSKFKDKTSSITEFVGLRSKMYSFKQ